METKPHVPGYGKEGKIDNYLGREMTLEEIDAMSVEPIEVIKKGVVHSKVEALRKPDESAQKHVRGMILNQIDAEMMKPVNTDIEKRIRDMKVQKLKEKMGGVGRAGNA